VKKLEAEDLPFKVQGPLNKVRHFHIGREILMIDIFMTPFFNGWTVPLKYGTGPPDL
jgi:hypothetical protein